MEEEHAEGSSNNYEQGVMDIEIRSERKRRGLMSG